ncbi:hypothetical protein ACN42_g11680 [Penicillium freii]|uniref:Uncharacterized protein n=1 Tax=Penicillium freii TaxID=48697 RepID=A0A101M7Z2_PENFR|nr:hypothetical protein ACN42_g11680 [Penicillium freii]
MVPWLFPRLALRHVFPFSVFSVFFFFFFFFFLVSLFEFQYMEIRHLHLQYIIYYIANRTFKKSRGIMPYSHRHNARPTPIKKLTVTQKEIREIMRYEDK